MLQNKISTILAAGLAAAALAGCGGGSSAGNQAPKVQFSAQVNFGDSLSDVGTYAVGEIAALGGGRYTVNSIVNGKLAATNWSELIASQLNVAAPCPAVTGLDGDPAYGFDVPVVTNTSCTSYAMGGAMVTSPYGPGNANLPAQVGGSAVLGQLTYPLVTQMQNYLAAHTYTGNEVVFVMAGGNDAIVNSYIYAGTVAAAAAGGQAAAEAAAQTAAADAVQALGLAGAQLAGYINQLILAQGAKHVVVLNLPDLSTTPLGTGFEAALPGTAAVINAMVVEFNSQLAANLTSPDVLLVDVHTVSADEVAHPSQYGLTNVTDTACNLNSSVNPLGSSLVCNSAVNVISGDISHYQFADDVHPTPYGNVLLARYVASQMALKGWM